MLFLFLYFLLILSSKQIRTTLKEQMEQKAQTEKNQLDLKNRSTELVLEQDRQFLEQEKQRNDTRTKLLSQISIKNKEVKKEYLLEIEMTLDFLILVNRKQKRI
jgi:hypothetical protein